MLAEHRAACGDFTVVLIGARSGRGLCVSGRNGRARTQDHRRARLQTTQETCPGDRWKSLHGVPSPMVNWIGGVPCRWVPIPIPFTLAKGR
jgi:hypothetical protein